MDKSIPHEREFLSVLVKQSRVIEVPKISCRGSAEVVKSILQERSSERRCEQSEVIKVTSSQDQTRQRTVEQNLGDTRQELASRSFERVREKAGRERKEKNQSVFLLFEEGSTICLVPAFLFSKSDWHW